MFQVYSQVADDWVLEDFERCQHSSTIISFIEMTLFLGFIVCTSLSNKFLTEKMVKLKKQKEI